MKTYTQQRNEWANSQRSEYRGQENAWREQIISPKRNEAEKSFAAALEAARQAKQ